MSDYTQLSGRKAKARSGLVTHIQSCNNKHWLSESCTLIRNQSSEVFPNWNIVDSSRNRLSRIPEEVSSDPLGFWRAMLSEISLPAHKGSVKQPPRCVIQTPQLPRYNSASLPDASFLKEFVPTLLDDVVRQVWLRNPLFGLSVLLEGFDLETKTHNDFNMRTAVWSVLPQAVLRSNTRYSETEAQ